MDPTQVVSTPQIIEFINDKTLAALNLIILFFYRKDFLEREKLRREEKEKEREEAKLNRESQKELAEALDRLAVSNQDLVRTIHNDRQIDRAQRSRDNRRHS